MRLKGFDPCSSVFRERSIERPAVKPEMGEPHLDSRSLLDRVEPADADLERYPRIGQRQTDDPGRHRHGETYVALAVGRSLYRRPRAVDHVRRIGDGALVVRE